MKNTQRPSSKGQQLSERNTLATLLRVTYKTLPPSANDCREFFEQNGINSLLDRQAIFLLAKQMPASPSLYDTLKRQELEFVEFIDVHQMPDSVCEVVVNELTSIQSRIRRIEEEQKREQEVKNFEENETPENLIQYLANAATTSASAGGHNKAYRNEEAAKYFKGLLTKRNIPIPSNEELYKIGIFNGKGAN